MLDIQGDYGEGGGSITRLSIALSAITKKGAKISKIRSKRCKGGLREQHLRGVKAVAELCNAKLKGASLGSTEIEFVPGKIEKRKLVVQIGTSGSVGLLLQCAMLPCFFADHPIEIEVCGGGTLGLWSPNILYTKNILLPTIKRMGFEAEIEVKKHGFYPKGGSHVVAKINPVKSVKPIVLEERGKLKTIKGVSIASTHLQQAKVCERTSEAAEKILKSNFSCPIQISNEYVSALCPGSGLILWAEFDNCVIGWDALGERGKPSFKVGEEAANGLVEQLSSGGVVDEYLSDQLIAFMSFASGKSVMRVPQLTMHAKTNMWLVKNFLPVKFEIKDDLVGVFGSGFHV